MGPFWLHNEFLLLNNAKIAKSSGPVPRLADLIEDGYHPMAYRLFLLGGHYRSQLDFTTAAVDGAQTSLRRLLARIEPLRPLPVIETYEQARAALTAIADTTTAGADPAQTTPSPVTRPRLTTWTRSTRRSPSTWPPPAARDPPGDAPRPGDHPAGLASSSPRPTPCSACT